MNKHQKLADGVAEVTKRLDALTRRADAVFGDADQKYRSWKEWNDAETKLLQKRNAAQRDVDKFWKMEDAAKKASAEKRLQKALIEIEDHQKHYTPSTSSSMWGRKL